MPIPGVVLPGQDPQSSLPGLVTAPEGSPPGSLISADTQIEWRGLLMGVNTWFGYASSGLTGWEDLPGIDTGSTPRTISDGSWPGMIRVQERTVTFNVQVWSGATDFPPVRHALLARTEPGDTEHPLVIRQHGQTLQAYGRVTARAATIEREYFLGVPGYVIQWTCSDPLRYSAAQESLSLSPPTGEGGLHWEEGLHWEDGLNWGSLVYSSASATNDGTASTSPMVYLHGPLSAPYAVVAPDAGWRLGFDLELAEEETLVVDTRNGTATLGGKNRLYTLSPTSDIPEDCLLPPGSTSLQLSTRDFTDAGSAVVAWRHAYT